MTDRLTKADWIKHGLRTLAEIGAGGLKVGLMSARLKVSRGSFYWHFADVAEFRSELLRSWRGRTTDAVILHLETESTPERLRQLTRRAFGSKLDVDRADRHEWAAERAIRSWAMTDTGVATMVASVDASRIEYISQLLIAADVEPRRAAARAIFLYWAYLGQASVMDRHHTSLPASALDDISDLLET